MKKLLQLVGPTAVGKSAAALELALACGGEIISADSMQVYRSFDIGTDKPTAEVRNQVKHHLIDIFPPERQFNGSHFLSLAFQAAEDISARGRLPIICGGTALYLRLIRQGIFAEEKRSPELRRKLQERVSLEGPEKLWRELHDIDPAYAAKIGPNDPLRIVRGLEIAANTGSAPTEAFKTSSSPFHEYQILRLGLQRERSELYKRIDQRVEKMISAGLKEETAGLLKLFPENCPPFRGLGYREMLSHLRGELELEAAVSLCQMNTRRYAKRQLTWLRSEKDIAWFPAEDRNAWLRLVRNYHWKKP